MFNLVDVTLVLLRIQRYRIILNMKKEIAVKILNDILGYLGMSVKQFSDSLGKDRPQWAYDVLNPEKKVGISQNIAELIIKHYPQFNKSWLLTGEGEMLNDTAAPEAKGTPAGITSKFKARDYRLVPIVHIDSVGGMHSQNSIVQEPQYIEGYAPFTDAREGDICIIQSGDSMTPTCPAGSLLLIRRVESWREYLGYGNIFVLELTDGRRITKEVTKYAENPKDYVWCVSHNPDVPDEELPKSMIVSVWKVIKIQTDKGW